MQINKVMSLSNAQKIWIINYSRQIGKLVNCNINFRTRWLNEPYSLKYFLWNIKLHFCYYLYYFFLDKFKITEYLPFILNLSCYQLVKNMTNEYRLNSWYEHYYDFDQLKINNNFDHLKDTLQQTMCLVLRTYNNENIFIIGCGNGRLDYLINGGDLGKELYPFHLHQGCYTLDMSLDANPSTVAYFAPTLKLDHIPNNSFNMILFEGGGNPNNNPGIIYRLLNNRISFCFGCKGMYYIFACYFNQDLYLNHKAKPNIKIKNQEKALASKTSIQSLIKVEENILILPEIHSIKQLRDLLKHQKKETANLIFFQNPNSLNAHNTLKQYLKSDGLSFIVEKNKFYLRIYGIQYEFKEYVVY